LSIADDQPGDQKGTTMLVDFDQYEFL